MTGGLPEGWAKTKLNYLLEFAIGGDWGVDSQSGSAKLSQVKVIRGTDFRNWKRDKGTNAAIRRIKPQSLQKRRLMRGDLVLEVSGGGPDQPVGRTVLIDQEVLDRATIPLVCSNFFRLIRLVPEIDPPFLSRFLEWAYQLGLFNQFQTQTTNLRNLNVTSFLGETEVLVCPLVEQQRIAKRLERLLSEVDQCKERISKIPVLLSRFRQSVLAAACSGNLTADWRVDHPESVESRGHQRSEIKIDQITETPDSWNWLPLVEVCDPKRAICYGVIKLGTEVECGVPCLRTSDVRPLKIDSSGVKRISQNISDQFRRTVLQGEEVLVNVRGTLGGVAAVPKSMREWNISREVAMVPVVKEDPEYVAFWIASLPAQNWLTSVVKGVAYAGINIEDLRKLPIALPSIEEQGEIVRRVKELLALADRIETRYETAKKRTDGITQSILAKAFRGELVPTEVELAAQECRAYESADQLLARIRAEKTTADSPAQVRKKRKTRS